MSIANMIKLTLIRDVYCQCHLTDLPPNQDGQTDSSRPLDMVDWEVLEDREGEEEIV